MKHLALHALMMVVFVFLVGSAGAVGDFFADFELESAGWTPWNCTAENDVYGAKVHLNDGPGYWTPGQEWLPFCDLKYLSMGSPGSPDPPYDLYLEWSDAPTTPLGITTMLYNFQFKIQDGDSPVDWAMIGLFNETPAASQYFIRGWVWGYPIVDVPISEADYTSTGTFRIVVDNVADTISLYYGLGGPPTTPITGSPFAWLGADKYHQLHLFSDYWTDGVTDVEGVAVDNVALRWGKYTAVRDWLLY